MYEQAGNEATVTQGDIIDDCKLLLWRIDYEGAEPRGTKTRMRVVVLTQACDLATGKSSRVLVAAVQGARHLVESGILTAKIIREQIRNHRVYGWYFLPASGSLEESIVDLHNLHSIPRLMVEQLVRDGKRVCRITTPYREHMAQHFSVTYSRIGLPEPYPSEPE